MEFSEGALRVDWFLSLTLGLIVLLLGRKLNQRSRFLQDFKGSVTIEVFSLTHLEASLDHFPELMLAADGCGTH